MDYTLFSRKKPVRQDFFEHWSKSLNDFCIPSLRGSSSSSSSAHSTSVSLVLRHLESYYDTLNSAADADTISYLLFSSWRNSLEMPFLFLGDIHPYILINIVRSLIEQENQDSHVNPSELGFTDLDCPWSITRSWKDPSNELLKTLTEVEHEMQSLLLTLQNRASQAHIRFVTSVSRNWVKSNCSQEGRNQETVTDTAASVAVDEAAELVSIFVDANLLRKKMITDLVNPMNNIQAHQFLELLCKFLAGFTSEAAVDEVQKFKNAIVPAPSTCSNKYTIFVGDLAADVTRHMLFETFKSRYSSITGAKIATYEDSGRCKGFGFVQFSDELEQQQALREMGGVYLSTKPIDPMVRHKNWKAQI